MNLCRCVDYLFQFIIQKGADNPLTSASTTNNLPTQGPCPCPRLFTAICFVLLHVSSNWFNSRETVEFLLQIKISWDGVAGPVHWFRSLAMRWVPGPRSSGKSFPRVCEFPCKFILFLFSHKVNFECLLKKVSSGNDCQLFPPIPPSASLSIIDPSSLDPPLRLGAYSFCIINICQPNLH